MVNVEGGRGTRATPPPLRVQVVYSARSRHVRSVWLTLPAGSTVHDALQACGWRQELGPELDCGALTVGVWTKPKPPETVLRDLDRVEIWRALQVDPKEARRLRYRRQPNTKAGP